MVCSPSSVPFLPDAARPLARRLASSPRAVRHRRRAPGCGSASGAPLGASVRRGVHAASATLQASSIANRSGAPVVVSCWLHGTHFPLLPLSLFLPDTPPDTPRGGGGPSANGAPGQGSGRSAVPVRIHVSRG